MDITTKSETELKALKSDIYESMEVQRQNLSIINAELSKRTQIQIAKGTQEAKIETPDDKSFEQSV